ncbi:MAG: phospholipase D-like domain-containing protein [Candidatus Thorarchaeota archaeon]
MRRYIVLILITILVLPSVSFAFSTDPAKQYEPAQFTLQTFNRNMNVTTFVGPDSSNETLTHFLKGATESIYVEIYQFTSPGILGLIHEIYNANPSIDIKVMISERVVSLGDYNVYTMWNLTQLGIPVRWTSDTFTFSHQKFVIIDNDTTIVQAGNWARPSFPLSEWEAGSSGGFTQKNYEGNREFNIAMTDDVVTQYYRNVFDYDWSIGSDYNEGVDGTGTPLDWGAVTQSYYPRVFASAGHFSGSMNVTPLVSPDTSLEAMLWVINSAQATLDIQIPYVSNSSTVVDELLDAIVAAKHRGVTVRIIMEEGRNDNDEVALAFAEENIPVCWMDLRFFSAIHNKAFIADGRTILLCSINWSEESISENREAGVVVEHEGVAGWYQAVFDYDWGIAEYDAPDYVNVGWTPHIPTSSSEINVTVYAHEYYNDIDVVKLGVKINDGAWTNHTITGNVFDSSELDLENFFFEIGPQADGTNITVIAYVESLGAESKGLEMVIPVRDSIGSVITTTTTTPGTSTTPTTPTDDMLMQLIPYIAIAIVAVIGGLCLKKKR